MMSSTVRISSGIDVIWRSNDDWVMAACIADLDICDSYILYTKDVMIKDSVIHLPIYVGLLM